MAADGRLGLERLSGAGAAFGDVPIWTGTRWKPSGSAAGATGAWQKDPFTLAASGAQPLTLSYTPVANSLDVKLNGVGQLEGVDYAVTGATLLVYAAMSAASSDVLEAQYVIDSPAGGGATGYAAEVLADNPAVYWRLGEASGTQAADASGNARHGTYVGSPTLGVTGLLTGDPDTCITLPGATTERVEITYAAWMDASAVTTEAVVQTTASAIGNIVDRDDPSPRVFQFRMTGAGKVEFIVIGGSSPSAVGSTSINDGNPHHVAATYDGATIKVYVDGTLDGSTSTSQALSTGANLFAGVNHSTALFAQPWNGEIDEVAYYTSALSAARIAAHAAAA